MSIWKSKNLHPLEVKEKLETQLSLRLCPVEPKPIDAISVVKDEKDEGDKLMELRHQKRGKGTVGEYHPSSVIR